jgi:type IV secretion system protein TrbL
VKRIFALLFLLGIPILALAYDTPVALVGTTVASSMKTISNELQTLAIRLLFSFLVLQWVIDGYGMLGTDTDISSLLGKAAKAFVWAMFCLWLLDSSSSGDGQTNLGHFMRTFVDYFLKKASEWAGSSGGSFDAVDILEIGLVAYGKITIAVVKTTATNVVNLAAAVAVPGLTFITALMVFTTSAVIIACCAYIALKVFMVKLQVAIFICMSPLSVAMLGLKGLREQGFAPLKAILGLVYRIIILAAIVSTMKTVADSFAGIIDEQAIGIAADIWTPILGGMFGFILLAFLTHKADELASSLASGSITMGSGDIASSIATGVAAGMAGGAALSAMQAAAGGQGLLSALSGMGGGGLGLPKLGVTNATPDLGSGGVGDAPRKAGSPSLSRGDNAEAGNAQAGGVNAESGTTGIDNDDADSAGSTTNAPTGSESEAPAPFAGGVPNRLPEDVAAESRKAERDAARAERRAAASGSGETASIGGAPKPPVREALQTLGRHAGELNRQLSNDKSTTHISIDHRHHD